MRTGVLHAGSASLSLMKACSTVRCGVHVHDFRLLQKLRKRILHHALLIGARRLGGNIPVCEDVLHVARARRALGSGLEGMQQPAQPRQLPRPRGFPQVSDLAPRAFRQTLQLLRSQSRSNSSPFPRPPGSRLVGRGA